MGLGYPWVGWVRWIERVTELVFGPKGEVWVARETQRRRSACAVRCGRGKGRWWRGNNKRGGVGIMDV